MRKKKPERVIESIANQNKVVNHVVDGMIESVSKQQDACLRSDWEEIQKTSELALLQDLLLGNSESDTSSTNVPKSRSDQKKQKKNKGGTDQTRIG